MSVILHGMIAIGTTATLDASVDATLLTMATGDSCEFLASIDHQSNRLIPGSGGFHFSDYRQLGLPGKIRVVAIGVPLLIDWPL